MKTLDRFISASGTIVRASALTIALASPQLNAQEAEPTTVEQEAVEEIVTLGTRVKGRTVLDSTVPIDIFPIAELAKTPSADLKDAIEAVSPSYYVHREAASSQDTFAREANLRGLDAGEVLILLNGKRVHRSAAVNKSSIQTANISTFGSTSISSVEVLRDGASALYGADAVAGVINLILDSSIGFSAQAGYSQYYEGDGSLFMASAKFGTKIADTGFLTVTAQASSQEPTNRSGTHLGAVAMVADAERRGSPISLDPENAQPNGIVDIETLVLTWNAAIPVNDKTELYLFGNYAHISNLQTSNFRENLYCNGGSHNHPGLRACSEIPELNYRDGSVGSPPGVFNPTRLTEAQLAQIIGVQGAANATYLLADGPNATSVNGAAAVGFDPKLVLPNGFAPHQTIEGPDIGIYGGVRGDLESGLNWDFSGSFGRSRIDWYNENTLNASLGAPMAPDGSIDYANAQTSFYTGGMVNSESTISLDMGYPVAMKSIEALLISFGVEYRDETYYNITGEEASWVVGPLVDLPSGSNATSGIIPATQFEASRSNYAAYVDFDVQVTEALNLTAAARFEDYSDFGSNTSGKASVRYEFIPDTFAMRGGISTGFHAPSLGQIDNLQLTSAFLTGEVNYGGIFPANHPMSVALGAEPLGPEEAVNYSLGLVWTPGDRTDITIDAYQIDLEDRIRLSQRYRATDPLYAPAFQQLIDSGFPNAAFLTDARFYGNGMSTRTKGIEMVVSQMYDFNASQLGLTLAYAYNDTEVTDYDPTVSNELTNLSLEFLIPPERGILTANYYLGDLELGGRVRWSGPQKLVLGYTNPDGSYRVDELSGVFYFDVSAAYQVNETFRLTVGADNLFDEYPDDIGDLIEPSLKRGYRYFNQGPPWQGGSYYARVHVSF